MFVIHKGLRLVYHQKVDKVVNHKMFSNDFYDREFF